MTKPNARAILQAQIKKRGQNNQLIHREFGDFAYRALSKEHGVLVDQLLKVGVSEEVISGFTKKLARVEVSDLSNRQFVRSALSFWNNELMNKYKHQYPDLVREIYPLEKMIK